MWPDTGLKLLPPRSRMIRYVEVVVGGDGRMLLMLRSFHSFRFEHSPTLAVTSPTFH